MKGIFFYEGYLNFYEKKINENFKLKNLLRFMANDRF